MELVGHAALLCRPFFGTEVFTAFPSANDDIAEARLGARGQLVAELEAMQLNFSLNKAQSLKYTLADRAIPENEIDTAARVMRKTDRAEESEGLN
jgi:hypothetical protein